MGIIIEKNEQGEEICRKLTADEGKLLYSIAEINELGENAEGFPNIIIPLDWDYEQIYIEKEITNNND